MCRDVWSEAEMQISDASLALRGRTEHGVDLLAKWSRATT